MVAVSTATTSAAFFAAMLASPFDEVPRLIFADYLEDREDRRVAFVRQPPDVWSEATLLLEERDRFLTWSVRGDSLGNVAYLQMRESPQSEWLTYYEMTLGYPQESAILQYPREGRDFFDFRILIPNHRQGTINADFTFTRHRNAVEFRYNTLTPELAWREYVERLARLERGPRA